MQPIALNWGLVLSILALVNGAIPDLFAYGYEYQKVMK